MGTNIKALENWNTIETDLDMLSLLHTTKKLFNKHYKSKRSKLATNKAVKLLYTLKQGVDMALETHLVRLQSSLALIEDSTGRFGIHKTLVDDILR